MMSLPVWLPVPMFLPEGSLCLVLCSFQGVYVQGSLSRGSLTGGLCPGGLCGSLWGVSAPRVSVQEVSSQGVSVRGSLSGGLCPGGFCGGLYPGISAPGVSVQEVPGNWGLCSGGSLQGIPWTQIPLYGEERAVRILLECFLVDNLLIYSTFNSHHIFSISNSPKSLIYFP